jgi:hypothetical protein
LISGEKKNIEAYNCGTLLKIDKPEFKGTDKKSGAKILIV